MHDLDEVPLARPTAPDAPADGTAPVGPARRRWPVVGAAALTLLVVAAVLLAAQRPAPSGVRIDRVGDEWVFRWDEPGPDPSEIEQLASEVGLDVTADPAPTGPSNVGRILGHSSTPPAIDIRIDDDPARGDLGFRVPVGHEGPLVLRLGSPADPGQEWASSAPATAPGEVLACRSLLGAPLSRTLAALASTDVAVTAMVDVDSGDLARSPSAAQLRAAGDRPVRSLSSTSDHTMLVEVGDLSGSASPIQYPRGC